MAEKQELDLANLEVTELEDGDLEGVAGGADTNVFCGNRPCSHNTSCPTPPAETKVE